MTIPQSSRRTVLPCSAAVSSAKFQSSFKLVLRIVSLGTLSESTAAPCLPANVGPATMATMAAVLAGILARIANIPDTRSLLGFCGGFPLGGRPRLVGQLVPSINAFKHRRDLPQLGSDCGHSMAISGKSPVRREAGVGAAPKRKRAAPKRRPRRPSIPPGRRLAGTGAAPGRQLDFTRYSSGSSIKLS